MSFLFIKVNFLSFYLFAASFLLMGCGGISANNNNQTNQDTSVETASEFNLVWTENFSGNNLDSSKWNIEQGYGPNNSGWGNDESQLYTDSADNLSVSNDNLVITARCDSGVCGKRDGSITSAKINTKGKVQLQYGKIEARIKVPNGRSTWPAFWMLGANFPGVPWPQSGEIDIMETHQNFSNINTTHSTIHWFDETKSPGSEWTFFTKNKSLTAPISDDYHLYTLEWDQNKIIAKIDDDTFFTKDITSTEMNEFQAPFYMILNIAIDGTLGGTPDAIKTTKQEMLVDWIKVYENSNAGSVDIITPTTSTDPVVSSFDSGLLSNGDFGNGASGWTGNAANVTDELLGVDASKANFASVASAGNPWDVNLSQVIEIEQGKTYKLSFKARSDGNRTMFAGIGLNEEPFTNQSNTVNLTTQWQTFELTLSSSSFGNANSRVLFDMGADIGQVIIDDVSLEKVN